ncbi:MAG: peptidylprolyl isomerase [Clostridia bacterium]|nr:peptidylprolyl isomerase [Clostridia bacterium]
MKKLSLRFLSLVLALVLGALSLTSCAGGGAAVKYRDLEVSTAIFQYLCCLDKTGYLYEANRTTAEKTQASQLTDVPAIWAMVDDDGKTVADNLKDGVVKKLEWMLYLEQVALDKKQSLSDEDKARIKNSLNELVKKFETKTEFNKVMKNYGINYDQMYDYYLHQGLAYIGNELLFGEGGSMEISESTAKAFFQKSYVTVECVYINTKNVKHGNGKTVYMSDSEKKLRYDAIDAYQARLDEGADFQALNQEYAASEDPACKYFQISNLTFARGGTGDPEVEEAAFALSVGEMKRLETDKGVFFLQRRGLNNAYFDNEMETITQFLEDTKRDELLAAAGKDFVLNETYIDSISVADLTFVR